MSTWSARRLARDRRRPEGFVEPMLATPVQRVPTGSEWQFEVKHDGYRMIARAENGKARIWSRWGLNWTASFPSVAESLRSLGRAVVIDGEAVCQFEDGNSNFHALASDYGCAKAVLWAFDLLMIDGEDIRSSPLEERRARLLKRTIAWRIERIGQHTPDPALRSSKSKRREGARAGLGAAFVAAGPSGPD